MALAGPIVLATGGTGGHVFPAEALASELSARGIDYALFTDSRGKQWQGALAARPVHHVRAASPSGSIGRRIAALGHLALGFVQAWRGLARVAPSAVVGFGGYASVPTMLAARVRRLPAMLHEQNAVLGKANRLAQAGATTIATSFVETRHTEASRVALVGNPVREAVRALAGLGYRPPASGRAVDLLVFGGSQGAGAFARVVPAAIEAMASDLRVHLRVVQQCRPEDVEAARASYARLGVLAEIAPFFRDLPQRMAAAHLVIARSGASTVAELATIGRPSIIVPYPFAADDHQTANARALEAASGCVVMPETEFTPAALAERLAALVADPARLSAMAAAAHAVGRPDAAARLADLVLDLARGAGR